MWEKQTTHVCCSIIHNSQDMESTEVSLKGWMTKEDVGCVCVCVCIMEYYSIKRMKETLLLQQHRWSLSALLLSKITQTEKDKYCMISCMCVC